MKKLVLGVKTVVFLILVAVALWGLIAPRDWGLKPKAAPQVQTIQIQIEKGAE